MIYLLSRFLLRRSSNNTGSFHWLYLGLDMIVVASVAGAIYYWGLTFQALALVFLISATTIISITDFKFHIIPDSLTFPGIVIGLILAKLGSYLPFIDSLIGLVAGFGFFYLIAIVGKTVFQKKAMGGGDIKLVAMLGTFVGWQGLLLTILLASILGLTYAVIAKYVRREKVPFIPFGPFLGLAGVIVFCGTLDLGTLTLEIF